MSSIPSQEIVNTQGTVLAAGGAGLQFNGLFLTNNTRVPIGTVMQFGSLAAVQQYFGASSVFAARAAVYFTGPANATQTPQGLLVTQYPSTNVAAYLRGGNISALPLATLQTYNGTLSVTINGSLKSAAINLATAASFSNAAELIGQGLGIEGQQAATFTASVGGTFTCTSTGTTLNVSAVLTGSLQSGDIVSGTDGTNSLPGGTQIISQLTGTPGGVGTYQLSAAATPGNLGSCTVTSLSTVLNVTAIASGALATADVVTGTSIPANTYITGQISGTTGGIGTYGLSGTGHTIASEAMTAFGPGVVYDSISGAFVINSSTAGATSTITFGSGALATNLLLTQATGAVLSQGSAPATPAAFMTAILSQTVNWVCFATDFDPDGGSGNAQKQLFAAWKNTALGGNRFAYVCWDNDVTPTVSVPATASLGYILDQNGDSGTALIWEPAGAVGDADYYSAFAMGWAASINFSAPNGRSTLAFKNQAGLVPTVSDPLTAQNLGGNPQAPDSFGNGYSFYGAYGTAGQSNTWFQRGFITGPYEWFDGYVNQIWLLNQCQIALLTAFGNLTSLPFTTAGQGIISEVLQPSIQAGLSFGAFGPGPLTTSQQAQINQQAGANIAATISAQGWYLQFIAASPAVKASRGPQQLVLWYLDNGVIQSISLTSVAVVG
jgi:hypothetical protein